jgi:hypothetical protein
MESVQFCSALAHPLEQFRDANNLLGHGINLGLPDGRKIISLPFNQSHGLFAEFERQPIMRHYASLAEPAVAVCNRRNSGQSSRGDAKGKSFLS